MKSCPACHRTFEDTFTFCLVDGSILSAPFAPPAAPDDPVKRNKDSVPTEMLPTNAFGVNSPPANTWPSPTPTPIASAELKDLPGWAVPKVNYPAQPSAPGQFLIEPSSRGIFLLLYTLMRVLYISIAIGFSYLALAHFPAPDENGGPYSLLVFLLTVGLGLLLGAAQAAILHKWIPATISWIWYTLAAYVLVGAVKFIFFELLHAWLQPYNDLAIMVSEVSVLATTFAAWLFPPLLQLFVLRKYANAAAWWVIVGIAAAVLDYATFKLLPWRDLTPLASASIDVFTSGFISGILQAICLLSLRKKQTAANFMQR